MHKTQNAHSTSNMLKGIFTLLWSYAILNGIALILCLLVPGSTIYVFRCLSTLIHHNIVTLSDVRRLLYVIILQLYEASPLCIELSILLLKKIFLLLKLCYYILLFYYCTTLPTKTIFSLLLRTSIVRTPPGNVWFSLWHHFEINGI